MISMRLRCKIHGFRGCGGSRLSSGPRWRGVLFERFWTFSAVSRPFWTFVKSLQPFRPINIHPTGRLGTFNGLEFKIGDSKAFRNLKYHTRVCIDVLINIPWTVGCFEIHSEKLVPGIGYF